MTDKLTEEQLSTVLEFASGLYDNIANYGMFSPFSQNDNLLRINNNPLKPTEEKLEEALTKVPYDKELVRSYSEFMEVWDSIYGKTLKYYCGLLAYDLSWVCTNIKDPKEYQSEEYKKDLKRLYKFFDKFDYKSEFSKITNEVLKKGASFTWYRDSEPINQVLDEKKSEHFALQIMPDKYCKITGYTSKGNPIYDFDVSYFLNPTVDIKLFSPILINKFKDTINNNKDRYIPSNSLNNRDGVYGNQYVQTSPLDGAWCFKFDVSNYRIVPPFASMMKGCLSNDDIIRLQKDKDIIGAYYLLAGEIKTIDNAKTDKADQFKISPKTTGALMQLLTKGLNKNVKGLIFPAENIRGWQYSDNNINMATNHLKSTTAQGASASSLIYTTDKMAQFELENAIYTDYSMVKGLYRQYSNFLNYYVNKKTSKYKFNFTLDGLDRQWDREKRQTSLRNYSDKGIVLGESQWASALGMNPCDFSRSLEEGCYSDFTQKLTLMLNANTMKDGSGENGRPKAEGLDKSDKTEEVQDYGN